MFFFSDKIISGEIIEAYFGKCASGVDWCYYAGKWRVVLQNTSCFYRKQTRDQAFEFINDAPMSRVHVFTDINEYSSSGGIRACDAYEFHYCSVPRRSISRNRLLLELREMIKAHIGIKTFAFGLY